MEIQQSGFNYGKWGFWLAVAGWVVFVAVALLHHV